MWFGSCRAWISDSAVAVSPNLVLSSCDVAATLPDAPYYLHRVSVIAASLHRTISSCGFSLRAWNVRSAALYRRNNGTLAWIISSFRTKLQFRIYLWMP